MREDRWLKEWAAEEAGRHAPLEIERALRDKLRFRRRVRRGAFLAALGCLVLTVGLFHRTSPSVTSPATVAAVTPAIETKAPREELLVEQHVPVAVRRRMIRRPALRSAAPQAATAPLAADRDFVAVDPWSAGEPIERGTIVRVRIPRAALANYGVMVNSERWNEPARADLLLGEDGTVRAVRLISSLQ